MGDASATAKMAERTMTNLRDIFDFLLQVLLSRYESDVNCINLRKACEFYTISRICATVACALKFVFLKVRTFTRINVGKCVK